MQTSSPASLRQSLRAAFPAAFLAVAALGLASCDNPLAEAAAAAQKSASSPTIVVTGPASSAISGGILSFPSAAPESSRELTLTISNSGHDDLAIDLERVALTMASGTEEGSFAVKSLPAALIASGRGDSLTLAFRPISMGSKGATLLIPTNDAHQPEYSLTLAGVGLDTPATPNNVTVTNVSGSGRFTSLAIGWSAASRATSYLVKRYSASYVLLDSLTTTATSLVDSGVAPGATYMYQVQAVNASGSSSPSSYYGGVTSGTPISSIVIARGGAVRYPAMTRSLSVSSILPSDASVPSVAWKSLDTSSATIDESGTITFLVAGKAVTFVAMGGDNSGVASNSISVSSLEVGDLGQAGGTVFYDAGGYVLDSGGQAFRYLEYAPNDTEHKYAGLDRPPIYVANDNYLKWAPGNDPIGTGIAIGTGRENTAKVVAKYGSASGDYAALLCDQYSFGGYSDWFLPSAGEFLKIYDYPPPSALVGSITLTFWTSSECTPDTGKAWLSYTDNRYLYYPSPKSLPYNPSYQLWPIREF